MPQKCWVSLYILYLYILNSTVHRCDTDTDTDIHGFGLVVCRVVRGVLEERRRRDRDRFNSIYGILFVCRIGLDWLRPNASRLDWIGLAGNGSENGLA